uniref:uncharacterized protein LOC120347195 n=1 Tax=Styela clava TaxID=7725 RepID=UPI00193A0016|nr:uncharacterized protein LOC120347195 [Styela clava]
MLEYNFQAPDINGMTLPMLPMAIGYGFGIDVNDYDISNDVIVGSGAENTAEIDEYSTTIDYLYKDDTTTVSMMNEDCKNKDSPCMTWVSVIFILLFVIGIFTNIVGYLLAAANRKIDRHYHNFLHIFLANILLLLPLPFSVAARFHGSWELGNGFYRFLSVVEASATTILAFQLIYLMQTRAAEFASTEKKPTKGKRKIFCYFFWLLGFSSMWPAAMYDDVMTDVIQNQSMTRSEGGSIIIKLNTVINFVIPGMLAVCSLIYSLRKHKQTKTASIDISKKEDMRNDFRMAALYAGLFFAFWFPCRCWRIVTSSNSDVKQCDITLDIFVCIGILYSSILPIIYISVATHHKNKAKLNVDRASKIEAGEIEKLTKDKEDSEKNNNEYMNV